MLGIVVYCLVALLLILKAFSTRFEDIADKFQQSDYKVNLEWGEAVSYNKEKVECFHLIFFKYNRTTTVANLTFEYNFNLANDLEIVVQAYKFASNEYRLFPLRFQFNFCFGLSTNIAGSQSCLNCGNFTGCPVIKGKRSHICNWAPDEKQFPPYMPTGRYMLEIQGVYKSEEMFLAHAYGSVSRPLAMEK